MSTMKTRGRKIDFKSMCDGLEPDDIFNDKVMEHYNNKLDSPSDSDSDTQEIMDLQQQLKRLIEKNAAKKKGNGKKKSPIKVNLKAKTVPDDKRSTDKDDIIQIVDSGSESDSFTQAKKKSTTSKLIVTDSSDNEIKMNIKQEDEDSSTQEDKDKSKKKQAKRLLKHDKTVKAQIHQCPEPSTTFETIQKVEKKRKAKRQPIQTKKQSDSDDDSSDISPSEAEEEEAPKLDLTPKNKKKKAESQSDDEFLASLNAIQYNSRDLKKDKQYKLLDLSITEETGFNGKYRKAIGTFLDSSKPNGTIIVVMPKPVSLLSDDIISTMKRRIASGKNPHYVVSNVTTRERADGKGSYDIVDFKWV